MMLTIEMADSFIRTPSPLEGARLGEPKGFLRHEVLEL